MAKGSFNGVITGKKGNTVFYRIKNSNNAEKQGWREYNAKVSNPQSDGQIDQRVKLQAVNNLYRALKPIIQRGWENHKYGDESRRAFLKRALGASFEGPYIEKGSTLAVPIENVPIMYGSLTPIVSVADDQDGLILANVPYGDGSVDTIGDLSARMIAAGVANEGDQITIVVGVYSADSGSVIYTTISFFVNTADETEPSDVGFSVEHDTYEGQDVVILTEFPSFGGEVVVSAYCALVSVSRDGDGQHLRSTAEFDMTTAFRNLFYGNAAAKKAAAKASYIKTRSAYTNWEQVPGEEGGGSSSVVAVTKSGVELTPRQLINVDAEPARLVSTDGERYYLIAHTDATDKWLYGQGTDGWTSSSSAPSGSTNANTIDPCAADNIAGGFRDWLIAQGVPASLLVIA